MSEPRYAILALAPQSWHGQWVGRQQLLSRIGRHHAVLYSTGGWFVWDRRSSRWQTSPFLGRISASDNVWLDESPRYLMRWPRIGPLDRAVMRLQARRWERWIAGQGKRPLIAYICHPAYVPYLELLKPDYVVYNAYDLFDHMPDWDSDLDRLERSLLRRADLVFCPSEMVARALREKVPRTVEVLPNAADVGAFFEVAAQGAPEPADLAPIPHPRIGWAGSLHPQLDYGLVAALAQRRPGWNFVFVGNKVARTEEQAEREYARCAELGNVHFLGYKHRSEVPAYVLNMDVNTMVYRLADESWTKLAYPLKLHEYLASGRPVVSVNLEMLQVHSDVICFATGPQQWEQAIEEALNGGGVGTPERRIAVARENSWDARAQVLGRWLADLGEKKAY